MMYFCPCPCNSTIDPETEESTFLALPRNLSYVQESYLDRHSVSARFVHNPQADLAERLLEDQKRLSQQQQHYHHHDDCHHHNHHHAFPSSPANSSSSANFSDWQSLQNEEEENEAENSVNAAFSQRQFFPPEHPHDPRHPWSFESPHLRSPLSPSTSSSFPLSQQPPSSLYSSSSVSGSAPIPITTSPQHTRPLTDRLEPRPPGTDYIDDNNSSGGGSGGSGNGDKAILASRGPGTGSFMSRVASSRLASFILSPKDEPASSLSQQSSAFTTNDDQRHYRDFSSSVDQLPLSPPPQPPPPLLQEIPDDNNSGRTPSPLHHYYGTVTTDQSPPTAPFLSHHDVVPDPTATPTATAEVISGGGQVRSPDHRGLRMDRGEDVEVMYSSSSPSPLENHQHIIEDSDIMISAVVPLTSSSPGDEVPPHALEDDARNMDGNKDSIQALVSEDAKSNTLPASQETIDADAEIHASNGHVEREVLSKPVSHSGKTVYPGKEYGGGSRAGRKSEHLAPLVTDSSITVLCHDHTSDKENVNKNNGQTPTMTSYESPDSDAFSEEGVFVNMMDDLDTNEKSTTVSDISDDTCVSVDSMFLSPDDDVEEEEEVEKRQKEVEVDAGPSVKEDSSETPKNGDKSGPPRMSVEEAISRAASDLSKMSMMMYPDILSSPLGSNDNVASTAASSSANGKAGGKLTRISAVRQSKDLTIHMSYENINIKDSSDNKRPILELPESPVYDDYEFNFNKKALRKSSSLKTNKTPPDTPHRKKVVRFADAMGLDLESVRHVLNMESPPRIPPSAMADLKQGLGEDRKEVGPRFLCPCFTQPGASDGFVSRVLRDKICLENAIITDLTITGLVRVSNICFHKSVRVRYTHNDWATFHDIAASYVPNSCDGPTDRFSFSIVAPAYFVAGNRLLFAVSFNADGCEYWDNNDGKNYFFECFAKAVPTENESAWIHFL